MIKAKSKTVRSLKLKKNFPKINWLELSPQPVIGVDEAGRGCLAGPVVAGAVILDPSKDLQNFRDSKLLSEDRREELFETIVREHHYAVGIATVQEIEELNILRAALLAMRRAVESLCERVKDFGGHVMVDGPFKIPDVNHLQVPVIKGDLRVTPISAASIVAKVSRDRLMRELHLEFPNYGFADHKGYATQAHYEALRTFGNCVHHRKTFRGVVAEKGTILGKESSQLVVRSGLADSRNR